ncbi:hypothetical protein M3231_25150 [Neobacillus mesonae]|nr:hypothetical protein [Neobacillus mesonae]
MHIGIDLDNTVLDATSTHLKYYNLASGFSFTPQDVNDFYMYRLYGWDEATRNTVYERYGRDIHWTSAPFPMAVETLQQLFSEHQITIVTARPMLFHDVTVEWLEHHNIQYHSIVLCENKLEQCVNAKIDVLIDDGPHYAREFAQAKKPVILYEQPYNRSIIDDYVYRASDWLEVKKHIDHLASHSVSF